MKVSEYDALVADDTPSDDAPLGNNVWLRKKAPNQAAFYNERAIAVVACAWCASPIGEKCRRKNGTPLRDVTHSVRRREARELLKRLRGS